MLDLHRVLCSEEVELAHHHVPCSEAVTKEVAPCSEAALVETP
jgi:hypothetical protein